MQVSTAITVNIMTILLPLVRTLNTALASGYAYGFVAGVVIWVIWQLAGVREAAQTAFAVGSTGVMLVGIPYGLATGLGGLFRPRSSPRYADIGLQGRWGLLVRVLRARLASGIRNRVLIVWVPKTPYHLMRPGHTRGSALRGDPAARPVRRPLEQAMRRLQRWHLAKRAMRPVLVVVHDIARQHRLQMSPPHDQHPVQQLTTDGADPSLGERVRPRRPHRCAQDSDALGAKDHIEAVGELRIPVADQEADLPDALCQVMSRLRACWVTHAPVGLAVTPRMCTRRVASSIVNSTYRRLSSTGSTWKQVARQHALGLGGQEPTPGQPLAARRRLHAGAFEQQPHGARRHPVAKLHEFAVDAPISPGRVLRRHPQDQAPQHWRQRRSTGWAARLGPVATDQGSMPAQQRLRRHEPMASALGGEQPGQRREHGAVWPGGRGRVTCRRSTATSWRSTSSSAFLDVCPRASSASQLVSWQKMWLRSRSVMA